MLTCLGGTVALAIDVLFFGLRGLVLHRIGRLGLSACLRKAVALAFEDVLFFGLVRNFVSLTYTLLEG